MTHRELATVLKGKSGIMCRGRNGWFVFDKINVIAPRGDESLYSWVEVFSKKLGRAAPIQFRCTTPEAREALAELLQEAVYRLRGGK